MMNWLIRSLPLIAAVLYFVVGMGYLFRKDYAWALVWVSYSMANVGLVAAAEVAGGEGVG